MADKQPPATPGSSNQSCIQVYSVTEEQISHQHTGNQRLQRSDDELRSPMPGHPVIGQPSCSYATGKESQLDESFLEKFYRKRKGITGGLKGFLYEIKLIMWLMCQGMESIYDERINSFILASNMDNVDKLDDIVIEYIFNCNGGEKRKLIFLQAKHKKKLTKITELIFLQAKHKKKLTKITDQKRLNGSDSNFSLQYYYESFLNIMKEYPELQGTINGPIFGNKSIDLDFSFVIFSNALFSFSTNKLNQEHVEHTENRTPSLFAGRSIIKGNVDEDRILCLSEATEDSGYYRLSSDKARSNKVSDGLQDSSRMTADYQNIQAFVDRLKLFFGQPGEDELEKVIKEKIKTVYKIPPSDVEEVYLNLKNKVENWWKDDNSSIIPHTEVETIFQEAARIKICFEVKDPVCTFTGRTEELSVLDSKIRRSTETITVISQMTAISGLGGIGKTELARRYIKDYIKDCYDGNAIWINAETEVTLEGSFRKLAVDKLGIKTKNANRKYKKIVCIVNEVYEYFTKRKCLFVFDNAEKSDDLKKFLPIHCLTADGKKPYILITSRNREWEAGIAVFDLGVLPLKDATDLVKYRLKIPVEDTSQDQEIQNLVKKLQMFPLAIQQAVAYMADQRLKEDFSINNYLKEYEEKTKELLDSELFRGIDNEYEKTTFTTWQITVDKIKSNKQYGELALRIFDIMALLAPDKVERKMFLPLAEGNKCTLESAVCLLVKYSMVNGEEKQSFLNVHRLVQQVTRITLEKQNKMKDTVRETFRILYLVGTQDKDNKMSELFWLNFQSLLSYVDGWLAKNPSWKHSIDNEIVLPFLCNLYDSYKLLSFDEHYRASLHRALAILETGYGRTHIDIVDILTRLIATYGVFLEYNSNHYSRLLKRALTIIKLYDCKDYQNCSKIINLHYKIWKVCHLLSETNYYSNDQETRNCCEQAVLYTTRILKLAGTNVEGTLECSRAPASGSPDNQKQVLERNLQFFESYYGPKDVRSADILLDLSKLYGQDEVTTQNQIQERALSIYKNHYGTDHIIVANTLLLLAETYRKLGKCEKQKESLEQALPIFGKQLDSANSITADRLDNLIKSYGALCNHRDIALLERHLPALHWAAQGGDKDTVGLLLSKGADPNNQDNNGATPLQWAARGGHEDIVSLLMSKGADPNNQDNNGATPLHWAAQRGHKSTAGLLLSKGADPNNQDNNGETPLHWAAQGGDKGTADLLLSEEADPNIQDNNGATPLQWAARGGHEGIVNLLLSKGADANNQANNGATPLHWAARKGYENIARLLLKTHARLNIEDKNCETPLHWAVRKGHLELIRLVLSNQENANTGNIDWETLLQLLHLAVRKGNANIILFLESIVYKSLGYPLHASVFAGNLHEVQNNGNKNVNSKTAKGGITPLHIAAQEGHVDIVDYLLSNQANPNVVDNNGLTPLHWALRSGHEDIVCLLLSKQADQNVKDNYGLTPLHWAVVYCRKDSVRLLLNKQADPNIKSDYGQTPLHWAVLKYPVNPVSSLLSSLDGKDNYGQTPLHLDVEDGGENIISLLLSKQADPNIKNKEGETPLHLAAQESHTGIVRSLLSHKADPNIKDKYGRTPLYWAVEYCRKDSVRLLLDKQANPNIKNEEGETPLHLAAQERHTDIVRSLLSHKADPNIKDKYGRTPLDLAAREGRLDMIRLLLYNIYRDYPLHEAVLVGNLDEVEDQLKENINTKTTDDGFTPLHVAVREGHEEITEYLLNNCAEPNAKDNSGRTPLHWAVLHGRVRIICCLLENKAHVNDEDNDGRTPLHWAVPQGRIDIVDLLLSKQAETNIKDKNGKTPLDIAQQLLPDYPKLRQQIELILKSLSIGPVREAPATECLPSTSSSCRQTM